MSLTASLPSFRSTAGLFDDVVAQRAVAYCEPILARSTRAGSPAAAEWANRVYLVHKLLRDRRATAGTSTRRREWQRTLLAVRELVGGSGARVERQLLVDLLEALDGTRGTQPATPEWIAARSAYVDWLETQGLYSEALGILALSTGTGWETLPPADTMETLLATARLYRRLARWDASELAYARVAELAAATSDAEGAMRAELGRGLVATGRGNYPSAIAILLDLYERAAGASRNLRARIAHDLLAALERSGRHVDALAYAVKALELYESEEDRLTVYGGIGNLLGAMGFWTPALQVHECVRRYSTQPVLRRNAAIDALPALVRLRPDEFPRQAEGVLAELELMAPSMRVDARYQSGMGYLRLGALDRGRRLLAEALTDAAENELHHWYFRIETALREHAAGDVPAAESISAASLRDARLGPLLAGIEGAALEFAGAGA